MTTDADRDARSWRLALGWGVALVAALACGTIVIWLVVRGRPGWTDAGMAQAVTVAVAIAVALVTVVVQIWTTRQQRSRSLDDLRAELVRAVAARRYEAKGQLDQMLRWGPAMDMRAAEPAAVVDDPEGPRLPVGPTTLTWSAISSEWTRAPGRLVVLGEPGYGKTVAALMLLKQVNAEKRRALAEMFPLAEWFRWATAHPAGRLADWLAYQLAGTYRHLTVGVARSLVDSGMVLPILDGLDEVPAAHRRACTEAIDGYAERAAPFRPFVLTCRSAAYAELAQNWVSADCLVVLTGLDPDQVQSVLDQHTSARPRWTSVRQDVAGGDPALLHLFRSPLRLATAIEAYRDGDPTELAGSDTAVEARLWDRFLRLGHPTFHNSRQGAVRSWLDFLARGMTQNDRQRLWLHELYLYAPDRAGECRRFCRASGLVAGLAGSFVGALTSGPIGALAGGLIGSTVFGWSLKRECFEKPAVPLALSWMARLVDARRQCREGSYIAVPFGVFVAVIGVIAGIDRWGPVLGMLFGLLYGVVAYLLFNLFVVGLPAVFGCFPITVAADAPEQLAGGGRSAHLAASRNSGLAYGLVSGLVFGLVTGVLAFVLPGDSWLAGGASGGVRFGLAFGLLIGAVSGFRSGLGAWIYNRWLRRRLCRLGRLPGRLPEFLDWCAQPPRGWLRANGAYEFRHRALLDHLAGDAHEAPEGPVPPSDRTPGRTEVVVPPDETMPALQTISLSIEPGQLVGILGGSGAGKTTLLEGMAGLRPTGRAPFLVGQTEVRQRLSGSGNVVSFVPVDGGLSHAGRSLKDELRKAARRRHPPEEVDAKVAHALGVLGLSSAADTPLRSLSGGQKKLAGLARELLRDPDLLLLDEPTNLALPNGVVLDVLRQLADRGKAVVFSAGPRDVRACDRVIMLREGHLVYDGTPSGVPDDPSGTTS